MRVQRATSEEAALHSLGLGPIYRANLWWFCPPYVDLLAAPGLLPARRREGAAKHPHYNLTVSDCLLRQPQHCCGGCTSSELLST